MYGSEGGEGGPEGPPPSPPAFTPPQTAPPVVAPPSPPPPNPVWTDESIGEEVPNTVAAAPQWAKSHSPSNVADPADQQWSFFPPGFGGGEGDDEGPTDETEQQATQQQLGSQTIDVETPTVELPSGPIDWGQTGTTFTLDPGDEGMPPAGENIYGHGRGDIEDAEGSAELPPDVSRTDVIRDSARDKGLKTLKDIEEARTTARSRSYCWSHNACGRQSVQDRCDRQHGSHTGCYTEPEHVRSSWTRSVGYADNCGRFRTGWRSGHRRYDG